MNMLCRDHLILWDLDSGYIKGRIKTSYKETLLSSMDRDSQIMSSKEKTGIKTVHEPCDACLPVHLYTSQSHVDFHNIFNI